jgi:hypothetical protein
MEFRLCDCQGFVKTMSSRGHNCENHRVQLVENLRQILPVKHPAEAALACQRSGAKKVLGRGGTHLEWNQPPEPGVSVEELWQVTCTLESVSKQSKEFDPCLHPRFSQATH